MRLIRGAGRARGVTNATAEPLSPNLIPGTMSDRPPSGEAHGPCPTAAHRLHGPGNSELRVVPDDAAFRCVIVVVGDLVDHLGVQLERAEPMQEAAGDPELLPVLRAKLRADVAAEIGRSVAYIDRHVPDCAAHHAHQLALHAWRDLHMRPADHAATGRVAVVVLYELWPIVGVP